MKTLRTIKHLGFDNYSEIIPFKCDYDILYQCDLLNSTFRYTALTEEELIERGITDKVMEEEKSEHDLYLYGYKDFAAIEEYDIRDLFIEQYL